MFPFKRIIYAASAIAVAASLSSCLDDESNSQKFQTLVQGYVIQSYDADSSLVFSPYFTVSSNLSSQPLQSVSFVGLNRSFTMNKATDFVFDMNPDLYKTKDLSKLNGTYTITATSTEESVYNSTVTIAIADADTLGLLKPKSLEYDGTTVKVQVPKVKNAASYGVLVLPFDKDKGPQRISCYYLSGRNLVIDKDSVATYSATFNKTQLAADSAYVRAYVTGATGLFQQSDELIRVAKNQTAE